MDKNVAITIDGVDFKAPEGINLIEAAEIAGIHIPNLCYLKGMKGIGACRLCLVQVEGAKNNVIACNTKVKEGMVVNTKTPEILESRKFVIDLILSMHPLDCMTCTKAGICNLQKYAYEFELAESTFQRKKFGHPVDLGNPFIKMSPDYCVLCGRCVRVCKEQGTNVLEFMGRGVGAKVTTVVDRSLHESSCTFCGSCIDVCPVNSIIEYDRVRKGREWEYEKAKTVCMLCGNACDLKVKLRERQIMKISAGAEKGSAMKYICAYGRFGFDYLESDNRLTTPMKRVGPELVETTWDDALKLVSEALKKGDKNTGILSVASLSNEDALTMKRFAEKAVKTKNYDTTMSLYADPESMINSQKALIGDSDLIVTVGIDPSQRTRVLPALNVSIRKRVERGAKLITINRSATKLDKAAALGIRGDEADTLKALVKALIDTGIKADKKLKDSVKGAKVSDEIKKAAEMIADADNPVIFTSPALFDATQNISLLKGKVLAVSYESNSKGIAHMGLVSKGKSYKEMSTEGMKVIYAIGEVPLNYKPSSDFLIVQNSHITELAKHADVLLPSATYLEASGTVVDYKGRLRHISRLIEPMGKAMTHTDIFIKVAKALGTPIKGATEAEVKKALISEPEISVKPFKKINNLDIQPEMMHESVSSSLLSSSRLLWLKETEKSKAASF
jgi:NADH dehydrogenase/NADH:ubiquinone oxidoreductase subunit G